MKIYLIGMPGSGKSTLGKLLSKNLNLSFIDLDKEIETKSGKTIEKIFQIDGEKRFRELEKDMLKMSSDQNESFVMSTGGGAPCYHDNMKFMNKSGITVFLKVSVPELERRLQSGKVVRPLLAGNRSLHQKINELAFARKECYHLASIILESDSITLKDLEAALSKN